MEVATGAAERSEALRRWSEAAQRQRAQLRRWGDRVTAYQRNRLEKKDALRRVAGSIQDRLARLAPERGDSLRGATRGGRALVAGLPVVPARPARIT